MCWHACILCVDFLCEGANLIWLADGNKISKEANLIWLADSNKISK